MSRGRYNDRGLSPAPQFDEKGRVHVDVQRAENVRRQGSRGAEEQLHRQAVPPFYQSVWNAEHDRAPVYEVEIAGQSNGRVEPGRTNPRPTWDAVDDATKAGFTLGSGDAVGWGKGFQHPVRAGMNTNTLAPVNLVGGERLRQSYKAQAALPSAGRGRPNQADVTGA